MTWASTPAAWYPDPARAHEWRYFDGGAWTDDVSDGGVVTQAPLGTLPPGRLAWSPPELAVRDAIITPRLVDVPRGKMWVLAVLSLFVFTIRSPGRTIVLPLGTIFAIWCWVTTAPALKSHRAAGSNAANEIIAARWIAVALVIFGFLQAAFWRTFS